MLYSVFPLIRKCTGKNTEIGTGRAKMFRNKNFRPNSGIASVSLPRVHCAHQFLNQFCDEVIHALQW